MGFTLADAALIGNMGGAPILDPEAARRLEARAPRTTQWLRRHLKRASVLVGDHTLDGGVGLFDGELIGHPYPTVVKDSQVKTHRELGGLFWALSPDDRGRLNGLGVALTPPG